MQYGVGHRGVGEVQDGDAEAEVARQGEDQTSLAAARGAVKQNSSSERQKSFKVVSFVFLIVTNFHVLSKEVLFLG